MSEKSLKRIRLLCCVKIFRYGGYSQKRPTHSQESLVDSLILLLFV